jgi:hypothetical protein
MAARSQINEEYTALSPEKLAELNKRAGEQQKAKMTVPKQTKRAQKLDVAKVADSFQEAVSVQRLNYIVVLIFPSLMLSISALATLELLFLSAAKSQLTQNQLS